MKNLRRLEVRIRYVILSIKQIRRPHIGDIVFYNSKKCTLIQGVNSPYWNLLPMDKENLQKPIRIIYKRVRENSFELQPLRKRFKFSFLFTYNFLISNWYSIDIRGKGKIIYKPN